MKKLTMNLLTMENLEECFKNAIETETEFIGVKIEMQGFDSPEVIINPNKNFTEKLAYYKKAYGDDLVLKAFNGIKIVGFTHAERYEDIQRELLGFYNVETLDFSVESNEDDIRVGDMVEIIDNGEEYLDYSSLVDTMVDKFGLDKDIIRDFETSEELIEGDIVQVLAFHQHLESWACSDMVALTVSDKGYNLIGIDGIKLVK